MSIIFALKQLIKHFEPRLTTMLIFSFNMSLHQYWCLMGYNQSNRSCTTCQQLLERINCTFVIRIKNIMHTLLWKNCHKKRSQEKFNQTGKSNPWSTSHKPDFLQEIDRITSGLWQVKPCTILTKQQNTYNTSTKKMTR